MNKQRKDAPYCRQTRWQRDGKNIFGFQIWKCPECGFRTTHDDDYCPECGENLTDAPAAWWMRRCDGMYCCANCNHESTNRPDICPSCGAEMRDER